MKTDNWLVVLWHRGKVVAGDSLDRLTRMAGELMREGKIPTSPMSIVSSHTSAPADRAAAKLAEKLKPDGWWQAEDSAQGEERRQKEDQNES